MSEDNIADLYQQRADDFKKESRQVEQQDHRLSWLRILLFILSVIAFVYFANARQGSLVLLVLVVFVVAFPLLVRYHNKIRKQKNRLLNLTQVNRDELSRLSNQLSTFDSGESYKDSLHPYSGDLDIFGKHALFQLINRSNTNGGRNKVAQWMLQPAGRQEIHERQQAVKELTHDLDWCQDFQAYGMGPKTHEEDMDALLNWMNEPTHILQKKWYLLASRIMLVVAIAAIIAYFLWDVSGYVVLGVLLVNGLILWSTAAIASDTHEKTTKGVGVLKAYVDMVRLIENKDFDAPLNREQKQILTANKATASAEISRLSYILDNFDARGNMFYHILNVALLLDVYWLLQAEQWKKSLQADVACWFAAVNQMEALVSIASFAHANSDYVFPVIADKPCIFVAEQLSHCLISRQKRVSNDFAMEGKGAIGIITGSNMSGKSTFLRTVGINMVLALMGAPVPAKKLTVSEMQLFTSMRTQDNLEESVSSFYAELKRLKQLLEMLKNPEKPVMFMLDEILKGTNSQDRHHGAASLVRQLSQLDACGFVSTHDLELGALESQLSHIKNYSFTSTIENDEIYFDYKIYKGICQSFNASKLMAKMGIAIEE